MKCHKTIVLFALDSYLSTLLFAQRFLSLVARERDILLPRAWKEFQLQINATDDSILAKLIPNTNASKSRMLYKLLSLLERNADLDQSANSRSISTSWPTCDLLKRSIGPAKVPASSTETTLFIDLRKIDRFLFFPSLSFFPTLWRAPLHIGRVSRWQSGEIDAVGCQGSPLEGDRFSYQRFHLVFVFHRHTPSMIRVKPPFHLRDPLDPHCKPSNYGKHFCNVL